MATTIDFSSTTVSTISLSRTKYLSHLAIPLIPRERSEYCLCIFIEAFQDTFKTPNWAIEKVRISTLLTTKPPAANQEAMMMPDVMMAAFSKLPAEGKATWTKIVGELQEREDMEGRFIVVEAVEVRVEGRASWRVFAANSELTSHFPTKIVRNR